MSVVVGAMVLRAGFRTVVLIMVTMRTGLGSVRFGMVMVRIRLAVTLDFGAMVRTMVRGYGMSGAGKCYRSSCYQGDYE